MSKDMQHVNLNYELAEIEHKYGDKIHIISNPYWQSLLAKFSTPDMNQPLLNNYIKRFYSYLLSEVIAFTFPTEEISWDTRMKEFHKDGTFEGDVIRQGTKVVCVDIARAGMLPTYVCYDELNYFLAPENIRQDHFFLNRKINESEEVVGVSVSGSKIGGDKEGAIVLFPDPMGATGGSISYAINHYKKEVSGKALKFIAMHVIVTPEYIKRMKKDHPDVEVYALRLDRGPSPAKVLSSMPGKYPDVETGLNEKQYIVPGVGGVGEILNNSFV